MDILRSLMNQPTKIVGYSWVERGGRGYLQLNIFCGQPEDFEMHNFYLNEAEALCMSHALAAAVKRGLGPVPHGFNPKTAQEEQLMEQVIVLCFSNNQAHLDRPSECPLLARQGNEIQIVSLTGQRAFLFCASAKVAIQVQEALRENTLSDVRLSKEITKIILYSDATVSAAGLSDSEIAEMNRDYQRLAEDCWQRQPAANPEPESPG